MRHPYTPIFRDLLDSSLWASAPPATRCVWITFLLDADPEGYIPTSVPGLARRANVTVDEARAAIAMLEAPDPDSRTPDFEGRRVQKVPGGWQVLNFVAKRELAKHEAEKARKRTWAAKNGKRPPVANDNDPPSRLGLDASSETLDAPKPKPKPKPLSSEGEIPPTPRVSDFVEGSFTPVEIIEAMEATRARPLVITRIPDDWQPSTELRNESVMVGVQKFDEHLARLRTGPIGGTRGVFRDGLEDYIRSMFGKWRTWEETDRAKANSQAAAGPSRRFGADPVAPAQTERKRVQGAPAWVYEQHAIYAANQGLDLPRAAKAFARQSRVKPELMPAADVFAPFMTFLENLAQAREASA